MDEQEPWGGAGGHDLVFLEVLKLLKTFYSFSGLFRGWANFSS